MTIFIGESDTFIWNYSCSPNSNLVAPSMLIHALPRLSNGFLKVTTVPKGIIRGRNENEWGAIAVRHMHSMLLWTILPPADKLYAVDPFGVDKISPSPTIVVK